MRMGLELKLSQELRLTPQLILQMKLLQVSALDLEQLVRKELEENPALEPADDQPLLPEAEMPAQLPDELPAPTPESAAEHEKPAASGDEPIPAAPGEEYSIGELMPDDGYAPMLVRGREGDGEDVAGVELVAGPEQTLLEALMPRLRSILSDDDAGIAEYIIESLSEDGFRTMEEDEIAAARGVEVERVRAILYAIQRLEPGGIACRDPRESFLVQLELAGYEPTSLERKLLADHWDLLMKKQTARVARLCGVTEDEVRQAIQTIVRLESRPARQFAGGSPGYVSPDVAVEWRDGALVAVPNDETFPRLRLSQRYVEMLKCPGSFIKEQVAFAREKLNRALMFLRGIESRRRTLKKLVELVIDEQHDFFLHGPQHLKPATLRDAAGVLGVHPSTVSRTIAGKYVETDYGIFPLGYFFKTGTGDKSRTSIKDRIGSMIAAEDKSKPLSDDEICTALKRENISISRRTVAKYRGELGIAGCSDRKGF